MELARRWLGSRAHGIEIGAAVFAPFPGVRAWNVETLDCAPFRASQLARGGSVAPVDVWADAALLPFRSGALDFVLASHVIEHMPDAIRALLEWDRVLAVGGILFLIVPHRDRTMDARRPVTPLEALLADHALANDVRSDEMVPGSHYHVWRTADFLALVEFLRAQRCVDWEVRAVEDVDSRAGNGFTVVLEKRGAGTLREPDPSAPVAFLRVKPHRPFQVPLENSELVLPATAEVCAPAFAPGSYQVAAIRAGFPPGVAGVRVVEVGPPLPVPELARSWWIGRKLHFVGRGLGPTTWLSATYPDGARHSVVPARSGDELVVDLEGAALPAQGFLVEAENPRPGGGRSAQLFVPPPS